MLHTVAYCGSNLPYLKSEDNYTCAMSAALKCAQDARMAKNAIVAAMQTIGFKLNTEHIALCDLLKLTGLADSGGQAKALVAAGAVRVDGQDEHRKTAKIRAGQTVTCHGARIDVIGA